MKIARRARRRSGRECGYALLMIIFIGTLMLLAAMAVAPNVLTEGRREKEKELIWRGKQYARGIKLYYRKTGKFPTSMDDLTKPKLGNIRFMRQAYKDPMNKEDGSWRLIYVGPSGQLIGSLKPAQTLQMPAAPGAQAGTPAASLASPQQGTPAGAPASGAGERSTDTSDSGNPANVPSGDTPTIMGGNIIGVGSKVNRRSVMVYEKAGNYRLFEFIWDPSKDTIAVGSSGPQGAVPAGTTPPGTTPGQAPGTTPGMTAPTNPSQNPQQ
jgi:hypothetical protein